MMAKNNTSHFLPRSELRYDPVSGEWILISPARFHPEVLKKRAKKRVVPPASKDIFRDPLKSVSEHVILEYTGSARAAEISPGNKNWRILILENKYPAVAGRVSPVRGKHGFFPVMPGVGEHDLLITRGYAENFPRLSSEEAFRVFEAFRDRYLMFLSDPKIKYVSIFHNWGPQAGASVFHPHYQILAIPIVPPEVSHSIQGSRNYFRTHKKCAYCATIDWEKKQKVRVIAESKHAIAFAPFVSRNSFEVKIFPKAHRPFFENTQDAELEDIAGLLQRVLRKVEGKLYDPDYNFYIHTAPVDGKERNKFYHWHIEVIPRWSVPAGFEYATGIFINVVDPDVAAKILRSK